MTADPNKYSGSEPALNPEFSSLTRTWRCLLLFTVKKFRFQRRFSFIHVVYRFRATNLARHILRTWWSRAVKSVRFVRRLTRSTLNRYITYMCVIYVCSISFSVEETYLTRFTVAGQQVWSSFSNASRSAELFSLCFVSKTCNPYNGGARVFSPLRCRSTFKKITGRCWNKFVVCP